LSLEGPVSWVPMLQYIRKIHEIERIVHGECSTLTLLCPTAIQLPTATAELLMLRIRKCRARA
jgi:hypothetical protein